MRERKARHTGHAGQALTCHHHILILMATMLVHICFISSQESKMRDIIDRKRRRVRRR